jgi:hypothetical protein
VRIEEPADARLGLEQLYDVHADRAPTTLPRSKQAGTRVAVQSLLQRKSSGLSELPSREQAIWTAATKQTGGTRRGVGDSAQITQIGRRPVTRSEPKLQRRGRACTVMWHPTLSASKEGSPLPGQASARRHLMTSEPVRDRLGAGMAVLIDAFIVRSLLSPAVMRLLGAAACWSPRPLCRLHQRIGVSERGRFGPTRGPYQAKGATHELPA